MKKGMIVPAMILSLLIITVKSNADMRITPEGVTTPDDSAQLHLSGSFANRSSLPSPYAAVISGVNSYSGSNFSCGGYFSASGYSSGGVYGYASGSWGKGVRGDASGTSGNGVYGIATGTSGSGVYGWASNAGDVTNYGGSFSAAGTSGRGVFGGASNGSGTGVYGFGGQWDFYAGGPGTNYGPFTGAHEVIFAGDMPEEIVPGLIVSVTGKIETRNDQNGEISISSTLPTVTLSTRARDKAVFGVIVSKGPLPEDHWHESQEGERFGVVNALGEGRVWVTGLNGQIQAGDYITTSSVPGYGQMQDDDLLHSYTLGKAIETIGWDQVTETVQYDGKTYKRYLIAVVYTSG